MPNHRHGKMGAREEGCKGPIIEGSEWAIEAVVFGDGSKDKRGRELTRGQFYGSAKATGRHENFHPIDFQSLDVSKHGGARVELTTRGVSNDMPRALLCLLLEQPRTRNHTSVRRKDVVAQAIRSYCMRNPGVAVLLGGPGSRGESKALQKYLTAEQGAVFMRSNDGSCVRASLLNALFCLAGRDAASSAVKILEQDGMHYQNLKPLGLVVH